MAKVTSSIPIKSELVRHHETHENGGDDQIFGERLNINVTPHPSNYSITDQILGAHLIGIDNKLGSIVQTTAGVFNRINFTGDTTIIAAGTFFLSNALNEGTITGASPIPVINNDNQKKYFAQDLIGNAFPELTTFPSGVYSGQLTCRVSPNSAQQRYMIEIYKTDSAGNPIESGIIGAPVGSLPIGSPVHVVAILDSGIINLANDALTSVPISGRLFSQLTINTGERIRYHVSAEKVGTTGANITMEVFYGSDYNSFYDVPVTFNTDSVLNKSLVPGITATDAFNNIYNELPDDYTNVVYVNSNNPATATVFDLENPPAINDDLLKADVDNLYIGTDASTWVYKTSPAGYITKAITSGGSNFNLYGTPTDSGNSKTANLERTGRVAGADALNDGDYTTKRQAFRTELSYACSDEVSDLTVGTLITFRMPFTMILSNIKLSLNNAPTVTKLIVDIKENGVSIFSTLISADIGQTTSVGASVPAVISDTTLTDDSIITIMTTQIGSGATGKGLKVSFLGKKI